MKVKRRAVWFVCLLLGACLPGNTDGRKCAGFDFPTLSNNTLTAKENDTISFPFHLNYHNCTTRDFVLTVAKRDQETGRYGYFCKIPHMNGSCHALSQQTGCYCMEEPGSYRFSKTADMADNATWVWMSEGLAEDEEVIFRIIRPATIDSLTLEGYENRLPRPAPQNSQVDVVCFWRDGDPPVSARLLDRHGVEMEGSIYSSGQIRYTFPAVGCQDAGLIRCEAPWANHNQTATLLVTCPPEFPLSNTSAFSFDAARDAKLSFQVRTHTAEISDCDLTQLTSSHRNQDCSRGVHVTGSAPEFTVTVRLDNVRKQDEGQWTLTLTNEVGSGHVDFQLNINESADNEDEYDDADKNSNNNNNNNTDAETSSSAGVDSTVVTIAVVNVATVIIVAVVVLIIVSVRRSRRVPQREEPPVRYDVFRRSPAAEVRRNDRPRPREDSHIYDVVQDGSKDYTPLIRPPPAVPSTSADDYLHPTPPPRL